MEPPPIPKGKATLIGGLATAVDHVRNRVTLQPFGGGPKVKLFVDERSHIYRNGVETTILGVHKGDRVYVDTLLDQNNNKIFAKNLRVITDTGLAPDIRLFVIYYDPKTTETLQHSLGLEKGMIGVVNALASESMAGWNNVVVAHELLHTVGATDKYAVPLRSFPPRSVTHREVMRLDETSLLRLRIDPLTAEEIGWLRPGC